MFGLRVPPIMAFPFNNLISWKDINSKGYIILGFVLSLLDTLVSLAYILGKQILV